ncbi:MAG: ribonuclease HII [Halothiobacillus sp.]
MPQLPLFEMPMPWMMYAGVDEAGRGPLAGPVVAAAVILDPVSPIIGVNDSKKLSEAQRERLFVTITTQSRAFAIAQASAAEIDEFNILQASLLAMRRAVMTLIAQGHRVRRIHVDGKHCPNMAGTKSDGPDEPDAFRLGDMDCFALIGGDGTDAAIASASILAKVTRDRLMVAMDERYPQYEFARHKGYPTARHRALLIEHGACSEHRRSFALVRAVCG